MCTYKLEEIAKLVSGGTPDREKKEYYAASGTPWVKIENLDQGVILSTAEYLSPKGCEKVNLVPKDSVLFSIVGTVGKVGIAGCKLAMNQQIVALVFDEKKIVPMFGYYTLRYHAEKIKKLANQTTMALISRKILGQYRIEVPEDMERQQYIVERLQQFEALVREKQALSDKGTELAVRMFDSIFASEMRYHEKLPLREYLCLSVSQKMLERYPVAEGDILLRNGRALLADAEVSGAEKPDRQTCRIRTEKEQLYPEVLWGYLLRPEMQKILYTSANAGDHRRRPISASGLEHLEIPYFSREKQELYRICVQKIQELQKIWIQEGVLAQRIFAAALERLLTVGRLEEKAEAVTVPLEKLEEKATSVTTPLEKPKINDIRKERPTFYYDDEKKTITMAVDAVLGNTLAAADNICVKVHLDIDGVSVSAEGFISK